MKDEKSEIFGLPSLEVVRDKFFTTEEIDQIILILGQKADPAKIYRVIDDVQPTWIDDSFERQYTKAAAYIIDLNLDLLKGRTNVAAILELMYEIKRRAKAMKGYGDQEVRGRSIRSTETPIILPLLKRDIESGVTQEMANAYVDHALANEALLLVVSDAVRRCMCLGQLFDLVENEMAEFVRAQHPIREEGDFAKINRCLGRHLVRVVWDMSDIDA